MDRTSKKELFSREEALSKGISELFQLLHKILYIFFLSIISEAGFHKSSC